MICKLTLEASSCSISLWHHNFWHVRAIKFGSGHECCCKTLSLKIGLLVCVVTEAEINCLVVNSICLTYRISNKCNLTSLWISRQRRQPLLDTEEVSLATFHNHSYKKLKLVTYNLDSDILAPAYLMNMWHFIRDETKHNKGKRAIHKGFDKKRILEVAK